MLHEAEPLTTRQTGLLCTVHVITKHRMADRAIIDIGGVNNHDRRVVDLEGKRGPSAAQENLRQKSATAGHRKKKSMKLDIADLL